ncbi:MAG: DNA-3-methyladenine glycosylase I [Deinococcus sp.]|nr:DNA-3-methyladenine glycosylase I [Deinococcus sp.]
MLYRCPWATNDRLIRYHDEEWGVPVHDDHRHLEFLVLGGAQAGLSWDTILKRREAYRVAFVHFDAATVAQYGQQKVEQLLADSGIIRNRRKITSAIQNARAFLAIQAEFGSFDTYIWQFVGDRPRTNSWRSLQEIPARTHQSDAISQDLQRRGFTFVGSTICYAFMQATGLVNDHLVRCFRHAATVHHYRP